MQVEASRGPIEELDVQALAVAVFKNEKADDGFLKKLDELSGGLVSSALDAEELAVRKVKPLTSTSSETTSSKRAAYFWSV